MVKWRYSSTILNLGTRWRWVVNFTPRPLYSQGKSPRYRLGRRLGGFRIRSGSCGERSVTPARNRAPIPRSSSPYGTLLAMWRRKPPTAVGASSLAWCAGARGLPCARLARSNTAAHVIMFPERVRFAFPLRASQLNGSARIVEASGTCVHLVYTYFIKAFFVILRAVPHWPWFLERANCSWHQPWWRMGEWRYSPPFFTSTPDGGEWSALPPGKERPYVLYRRLGGPESLFGRCGEAISKLAPAVLPIAHRYTDPSELSCFPVVMYLSLVPSCSM
jgi:hypothetical protein